MSKQTPQFWFEWILASLDEGKEVDITAKGWSMSPTIKPGTTLTLVKTPIEEIKVGDIIAFVRANHFVVHRVEKVMHQQSIQIFTRGDANLRFDEMVTTQNYCGKVKGFVWIPLPDLPKRLYYYLLQKVQVNWARAKKIPSLMKRDK